MREPRPLHARARAALAAIERQGGSAHVDRVAQEMGQEPASVARLLSRLKAAGRLRRPRPGVYELPGATVSKAESLRRRLASPRCREPVWEPGWQQAQPAPRPPVPKNPRPGPSGWARGDLTDTDREATRWLDAQGPRPPASRRECADGPRPCPWLRCRYHLAIGEVKWGHAVWEVFPGLDPTDLVETCALDMAELSRQRGGMSLQEIGDLMNMGRESVRAILARALDKLRRRTRQGLELERPPARGDWTWPEEGD